MGIPYGKSLGQTSQFSGYDLLVPPIFVLVTFLVNNFFFLKIKWLIHHSMQNLTMNNFYKVVLVFDLDKNNLYLHTANDNPRIVLKISNWQMKPLAKLCIAEFVGIFQYLTGCSIQVIHNQLILLVGKNNVFRIFSVIEYFSFFFNFFKYSNLNRKYKNNVKRSCIIPITSCNYS